MIAHLRIDNRLIHGQVAVLWVKAVGAKTIVVVNDEVAEDPIQKMMLPIAAGGMKTQILSIEKAYEYLCKAPESERIFVVAKYPADALALLEKGVRAEEINVGNQAVPAGVKYERITNTIAASKEDAEVYRKIAELGYKIGCRMVPADTNRDFIELLKAKQVL